MMMMIIIIIIIINSKNIKEEKKNKSEIQKKKELQFQCVCVLSCKVAYFNLFSNSQFSNVDFQIFICYFFLINRTRNKN